MAVDDKFLDKYEFLNDEMQRAKHRGTPSLLCGLCEKFCDMVIKQSILIAGPMFKSINIEDLCGMIPDDNETNRYYYLFGMSVMGDSVVLELYQHQNSDYPVSYKLRITTDKFNRFLTWMFSYVDADCSREYLGIKRGEE